MPERVVTLEREEAIVIVRLDRPDRRNAIDQAMREQLRTTFAELDEDPTVHAVVLTGAGTAFCAGVDLKDAAPAGSASSPAGPSSAGGEPASAPEPVAAPLARFRKPIIAALNGAAVGGGLELALACDIRIAAEGARFGLPEVRIGSLPGSGGTQRLPRIVGVGAAARMILTGDLIDAAEALRIGLVSEVVAAEDLADRARDLARRVAANGPLAVIAAKEALRAAQDHGLEAGLAFERERWAALATTDDRAEGRRAFREGRPPRFTGR